MARTVVIRPGAATDLREITRYISQRVSQASATRWLTAIQATIARLATDADQFPQADEAAELNIDVREQLHGRQRHVYRHPVHHRRRRCERPACAPHGPRPPHGRRRLIASPFSLYRSLPAR